MPQNGSFQIKDLPVELTTLIVNQLQPESQVCLALTCHYLHDLVTSSLDKALGDLCLSTLRCSCRGHGWTYLFKHHHPHFDFFRLVLRLRDWIPSKYALYYFYHKYMKHSRCALMDVKEVKGRPDPVVFDGGDNKSLMTKG